MCENCEFVVMEHKENITPPKNENEELGEKAQKPGIIKGPEAVHVFFEERKRKLKEEKLESIKKLVKPIIFNIVNDSAVGVGISGISPREIWDKMWDKLKESNHHPADLDVLDNMSFLNILDELKAEGKIKKFQDGVWIRWSTKEPEIPHYKI